MKKFALIAIVAGLSGSIAACSTADNFGLCNEDHTFGCAPYSEERTVKATPKLPVPEVTVAPEPAPMPAPAPEPMVETVIDDTPIMQSAEPKFKHISK